MMFKLQIDMDNEAFAEGNGRVKIETGTSAVRRMREIERSPAFRAALAALERVRGQGRNLTVGERDRFLLRECGEDSRAIFGEYREAELVNSEKEGA